MCAETKLDVSGFFSGQQPYDSFCIFWRGGCVGLVKVDSGEEINGVIRLDKCTNEAFFGEKSQMSFIKYAIRPVLPFFFYDQFVQNGIMTDVGD